MTKNLLLSVSPTEALNVLNGKQLALLRKRVPKGYVGWCYGVVSKGKPYLIDWGWGYVHKDDIPPREERYDLINYKEPEDDEARLNGKIPFRFWYEEVEEVESHHLLNQGFFWHSLKKTFGDYILETLSCMTMTEIHNYFGMSVGNAIHITKLEVFDKPMELGDLYRSPNYYDGAFETRKYIVITKNPGTYQYVWVKE